MFENIGDLELKRYVEEEFYVQIRKKKLDKSLHWTTFYSEKLLPSIGAPSCLACRYGCFRYGYEYEGRTWRFISSVPFMQKL